MIQIDVVNNQRTLEVDDVPDKYGDVEFFLDHPTEGSVSVWLSMESVRTLRDHLDSLLLAHQG